MNNKSWAIALIVFTGCIAISCAGVKNTGADSAPQTALPIDEAVELAAADISGKLPKGTKIAVVSFASESPQVSDYLMEEIDFALLNKGLVVTDRANLESVRKELNFQMSGEVDDKTAQSIGKFLGVEYVVTGQFVFTGEAYRFRVITERAETAERVVASNLTVRNDSRMIQLVETLNKTKIKSHSAGY